MNVDKSFTFRSVKLPLDGGQTVKSYMMWVKSHAAIWQAFPAVNQSVYYKKIQLYGVQKFWMSTWFDRFRTTGQLGESVPEINECWASMLLYHLDEIWPMLDTITDGVLEQLTVIHRFTNRIKGAKFHGIAIATKCVAPDCIEGFLDLYSDIGSNEDITRWAARAFLPKHLGNKMF